MFKLKFPERQISHWASCYDYAAEAEFEAEIAPPAKARGYLTRAEFICAVSMEDTSHTTAGSRKPLRHCGGRDTRGLGESARKRQDRGAEVPQRSFVADGLRRFAFLRQATVSDLGFPSAVVLGVR
jgi:hypothetical protein